MTPEKKVQNEIVAYFHKLAALGKPAYIERRNAGGYSYKMGIADLYAVYDGKHIEIEVKAPGRCMRPMQEKWCEKCKALNILHICADCVDDIKTFMIDNFGIDVMFI